jgi:hypothetical protein
LKQKYKILLVVINPPVIQVLHTLEREKPRKADKKEEGRRIVAENEEKWGNVTRTPLAKHPNFDSDPRPLEYTPGEKKGKPISNGPTWNPFNYSIERKPSNFKK